MVTFKLRINDINTSHVHFDMWVGHGVRYTHAKPMSGTLSMDREQFQAFAMRLIAFVYIEKDELRKDKDKVQLLRDLRLNIYDNYNPADARPWFAQFKDLLEFQIKSRKEKKHAE